MRKELDNGGKRSLNIEDRTRGVAKAVGDPPEDGMPEGVEFPDDSRVRDQDVAPVGKNREKKTNGQLPVAPRGEALACWAEALDYAKCGPGQGKATVKVGGGVKSRCERIAQPSHLL